jgi:hypothetical protein
VLGALAAMVGGIAAATVTVDDAQWLRSPAFQGVPIINFYHKEKVEPPELSGPQNVHTYFRKELSLAKQPVRALAAISADDYCKLYINGRFVTQGPEPGYPFAYPYFLIDVTGLLSQGANCIAAHVYYQGLRNRVWNSADNRSGFAMAVEVEYADGTSERVATDGTWRCLDSKTFSGARTFGYKTQFAEDIDLRAEPDGWKQAGFDDSAWTAPLLERQDHEFVPQQIPAMQVYSVTPASVKRAEDNGRYIYDFGREIVGCTRIKLKGQAGQVVEVRHGEETEADGSVRYKMRANCVYQEYITLTGNEDVAEFYDYKAFRYVEILNAPEEPRVWVDVRHYPFDESAARFAASDELLVRTWNICKACVQMDAQGGFLDCPSREKGQYLGDAALASHAQLLLIGDGRLTAKTLNDFRLSQRICPGMMAVAPGSFMQELAEWSLHYPMMLRNYLMFTGDAEYAKSMADAAFPPLFEYFSKYETDAGLLSGMERWVLVDWPDNLRDDYDYEYSKTRENTVLNAFYYAALQAAADVMRTLGEDPSQYEQKAARVKQGFSEKLLNPETGLFVDAPGSSHSSLHANAIPLRFGLVARENVSKVLDLIRAKRLSCGVYIGAYTIEACYEAGDPALGYSLLTSRDQHSWHEMLRNGATTCMEAWGPDQKKNSSWCHAWSASPIYLIIERVLGVTPAEPGWESICFTPHIPKELDKISVTFPIPKGSVTVRYDKAYGCVVTVPPGTKVKAEVGDMPLKVNEDISHGIPADLTDAQRQSLAEAGWGQRVAGNPAVWVSVEEQRMRLIENGRVIWEAPCSTAANGVGAEANSNKTPAGWHVVKEIIGRDAAWGQVFKSKKKTEQIWRPGDKTEEDLVLTRVLLLDGLEEGKNKGGNVDSYSRCIYIHGTNDEASIGTPRSHGCIRLTNDDVIKAFEKMPAGTAVLIK